MDRNIESNLKALSLFQKPILLFISTIKPQTSQPLKSLSLDSNQLVTSQMGPTTFVQNMPNSTETITSTATNYKNKPTTPAKPSHTSNKLSRKSPYNTRSPKKPPHPSPELPSLMIDLETPTHLEILLPTTPNHQASKKRNYITELVSPPKKGPSVPTESENPRETTPLISNHPAVHSWFL